jgi:hypothetical protein
MICVLIFSCSKKKQIDIDSSTDYFPITHGKYIVYQVDSTVYNDLRKDTAVYKFLLKEKIADSFTDNQGKNAIRIERYIKKFNPKIDYQNMPWQMREVYFLSATSSDISIQENNQRFTKLVFPAQQNKSWNANASNNLGEQYYSYKYINTDETISTNKFENTLLVIQKENHPLTLEQYYIEKYAKGFGLVYKEITDVVSNSNISPKPVLLRIESGLIYKQTFLSIGYE